MGKSAKVAAAIVVGTTGIVGVTVAYASEPDAVPATAVVAEVAPPVSAVNDIGHIEEPPPGFVLNEGCPTGTVQIGSAGVLPGPPLTDRVAVPSIEQGIRQANLVLADSGIAATVTEADAKITDDARLVVEVRNERGLVAHLEFVGLEVDWARDSWSFEHGTLCR